MDRELANEIGVIVGKEINRRGMSYRDLADNLYEEFGIGKNQTAVILSDFTHGFGYNYLPLPRKLTSNARKLHRVSVLLDELGVEDHSQLIGKLKAKYVGFIYPPARVRNREAA